MLSENIKTLRKQKGLSQETLAQQLNVVRQTVSKWEKGLSVPDADLLSRLAELFEVSASALLGENIEPEPNVNEIAVQLALLNEQLANKSRRSRKLLKGVLIGLLVAFLLFIAVCFFTITVSNQAYTSMQLHKVQLVCTLDGKQYTYGVTYDDSRRVRTAGGDAFIANHVQTERYSDADVLVAQIEDYFTGRGGHVERSGL